MKPLMFLRFCMDRVPQANTVLLARLFLSVAQSIHTKLAGVGAISHHVCHARLEKSALQVFGILCFLDRFYLHYCKGLIATVYVYIYLFNKHAVSRF